jgi:hypothetical protein
LLTQNRLSKKENDNKIFQVFFLGYFFLLFLFMESMNIARILQFGSNLMVPGRL